MEMEEEAEDPLGAGLRRLSASPACVARQQALGANNDRA
jgi:hypothetical protein